MTRFGTADVSGVTLEEAWRICDRLDAMDDACRGRNVTLAEALERPVLNRYGEYVEPCKRLLPVPWAT